MSEIEKHRLHPERLPDKDFGERDNSNPSQQLKTAEKPQRNRETLFKSMIGGI